MTYEESLGITQDVYGMLWADAPGSAVFYGQANDPTGLVAIVQAIVSAAR